MGINESDLEWNDYDRGESQFRRKELSNASAAEDIGCSLYEIPPDGRSWPYHYHTANEEALFVLSGEGTLQTEDGETPLRSGEFVAFPQGERGGHRVKNDGDEPLRYLVMSTMNEPDITVYPERGTFGVFVGSPPGGRGERTLHGYYAINETTEYWDE